MLIYVLESKVYDDTINHQKCMCDKFYCGGRIKHLLSGLEFMTKFYCGGRIKHLLSGLEFTTKFYCGGRIKHLLSGLEFTTSVWFIVVSLPLYY